MNDPMKKLVRSFKLLVSFTVAGCIIAVLFNVAGKFIKPSQVHSSRKNSPAEFVRETVTGKTRLYSENMKSSIDIKDTNLPKNFQEKAETSLEKHLDGLLEEISAVLKERSATTGIIPFEDVTPDATYNDVGMVVTEFLYASLFKKAGIKLVERGMIEKALDELKLSQSGIVDENSVKQTGLMIPANVLICGSVTDAGGYFNINTRIVDPEKGIILGTNITEIEKKVFTSDKSIHENIMKNVQASMDSIQEAIVTFHMRSADPMRNDYVCLYPRTLDELIPDAVDGEWVWNREERVISHSVHKEIFIELE